MTTEQQERTLLFGILGGVTAIGTAALLLWRGHLLVPRWVVFALALPWIGFSALLRVRRDSLGAEGKYVDLWSIPHVVAGALLALFGLPLAWVIVVLVWWEAVEIVSRVFEHPTNRVTDIVIALAGWELVRLLVVSR